MSIVDTYQYISKSLYIYTYNIYKQGVQNHKFRFFDPIISIRQTCFDKILLKIKGYLSCSFCWSRDENCRMVEMIHHRVYKIILPFHTQFNGCINLYSVEMNVDSFIHFFYTLRRMDQSSKQSKVEDLNHYTTMTNFHGLFLDLIKAQLKVKTSKF